MSIGTLSIGCAFCKCNFLTASEYFYHLIKQHKTQLEKIINRTTEPITDLNRSLIINQLKQAEIDHYQRMPAKLKKSKRAGDFVRINEVE